MANIYVLDGAAETAINSAGEDLYAALLTGKKKAVKIDRFDTSELSGDFAACIDFPPGERNEDENLIQALLRRVLPRLSRYPAVDTIIWAGVKGSNQFIEQGAWASQPPCPYPYLPRHYSRWIADLLGNKKAALMEVGAACASSSQGVATGANLIASGRSKSVLVVGADVITRFGFTGFNALFTLASTACRPFDVDRDGLVLGDGAAAVLLAGDDYIKEHRLTPMARLTGWGSANDANHITGPARDGRGLIAAMKQALKKAGVSPGDIGAFCAHGTGTVYNDAMELTAVETLFGQRHFPIFSIKGAIGHTLGAAGGIEILLCARILKEGVVPGTTGLQNPEPQAHGRVLPVRQPFETKRILTGNSGFGGVNVALILENM